MKSIDCNIIKDLLPSYIDKVSSESTNKLVEEHLQTCPNCRKEFQSMNKEIDTKILFNQDDKIDYLKGYRKSKIKAVITAIILTIIIILTTIISFLDILTYGEFFVDLNEINVISLGNELSSGKDYLEFQMYNENLNLQFYQTEIINNENHTIIYIKTVGKYPFSDSSSRTHLKVEKDENVECIYLQDKKGNLKEIWNKNI